MMWNENGSWGHDLWWPGILIIAIVMIFCTLMMARMMGHHLPRKRFGEGHPGRPDAPERILANRLGSGEINLEEYNTLRNALQPTTRHEPAQGAGHVE